MRPGSPWRAYFLMWAALFAVCGALSAAVAWKVGAGFLPTITATLIGLSIPFAIDPFVFWMVGIAASNHEMKQSIFMQRWAASLLGKIIFMGGASALLIQVFEVSSRPLLLALSFGFIVCSSHLAVRLVGVVNRRTQVPSSQAQEFSA